MAHMHMERVEEAKQFEYLRKTQHSPCRRFMLFIAFGCMQSKHFIYFKSN